MGCAPTLRKAWLGTGPFFRRQQCPRVRAHQQVDPEPVLELRHQFGYGRLPDLEAARRGRECPPVDHQLLTLSLVPAVDAPPKIRIA